MDQWINLFREFSQLNGGSVSDADLYGELFRSAISEQADPDAGAMLAYPFRTGEFLAGLAEGRPLFVREPEARFNLANFMRAQLFGAFSPVTIGMNVMTHDEGVQIDSLVGHGGIFATPVVAQRILAAAFDTPIRVMTTASEGGAWGMAVLAGYLRHADTPHVMTHDEGVQIDSLVGHGGIFATPVVAQRILAAAFDTPIRVMTTASEGGAWGMAVLAGYLRHADTPLADYLDDVVFANAQSVTEDPQSADVEGFRMFFARFMQALPVERTAVGSSRGSCRRCRWSARRSNACRSAPNNRPAVNPTVIQPIRKGTTMATLAEYGPEVRAEVKQVREVVAIGAE